MPLARLKPATLLLLTLAAGVQPKRARAAVEAGASEISVARRLFEEGRAAEDAGRFRDAASKFRSAVAIKDTPGIRFHLAHCEEAEGALVDALLDYERARELIESGVKAPDVERLLAGANERLKAKLAFVTLRLPEDATSTRVELDGKPLAAAALALALPLNPGKHRLSASAAGRVGFAAELELAAGEARELQVVLPPSAPSTSEHRAAVHVLARAPRASRGPLEFSEPRDRASTAVLPRALVLAGEAALVVAGSSLAIGFGLARRAAAERYAEANASVLAAVGGRDPAGSACAGPSRPSACSRLEQSREDRSRAGSFAAAGLTTAGAAAVAFGLTYWLWPSSRAPARAQASAGPGTLTVSMYHRF